METDAGVGTNISNNQGCDQTDIVFESPSTGLPSFAYLPVLKHADRYKMDHQRRGHAYIFNNETFNPNLNLPPRIGTAKDRDDLSERLNELGFQVTCFNDPTVAKIKIALLELVEIDHSDCDCVVVAVLTHGNGENKLYARDSSYEAEHIWSPFTSTTCPTLAGKPKIFFLQACRGTNEDKGTTLVPRGLVTDSYGISYKIPSHADFLVARSSYKGFFSYRDPKEGTWFIQTLCKVLKERGTKEDLLSNMTTVSRIVATQHESPNSKAKQIPCITTLLTRKVFFQKKAP